MGKPLLDSNKGREKSGFFMSSSTHSTIDDFHFLQIIPNAFPALLSKSNHQFLVPKFKQIYQNLH